MEGRTTSWCAVGGGRSRTGVQNGVVLFKVVESGVAELSRLILDGYAPVSVSLLILGKGKSLSILQI